jgi:hypothetical protein
MTPSRHEPLACDVFRVAVCLFRHTTGARVLIRQAMLHQVIAQGESTSEERFCPLVSVSPPPHQTSLSAKSPEVSYPTQRAMPVLPGKCWDEETPIKAARKEALLGCLGRLSPQYQRRDQKKFDLKLIRLDIGYTCLLY